MARIAYLDMDGVLVDFVGGAIKEHCLQINQNNLSWDFYVEAGLSPENFWSPLGRSFWANLDWTPEGEKILAYVEQAFDAVVILSSPCATHGCAEGKIDWIKRHIPRYRRQFLLGPAKHFCASPNHYLIDDHDQNIEKFIEWGGKGFLVPRAWNRACTITTDNKFNVEDWINLLREYICSSA